jgi:hypothetical protein
MKMSNLRKVKNASKVRYFSENSIGARINEILVKHGENVFNGVSFEDQVKKSSNVFKTICTEYFIKHETKQEIYNPYSGKTAIVENWIAFLHSTILALFSSGRPNFTKYDCMVFDSIKVALMLEYTDVYYDFFD